MSTLLKCDNCGKIVETDSPEDRKAIMDTWIHDSDYDNDFCSSSCHVEWWTNNPESA